MGIIAAAAILIVLTVVAIYSLQILHLFGSARGMPINDRLSELVVGLDDLGAGYEQNPKTGYQSSLFLEPYPIDGLVNAYESIFNPTAQGPPVVSWVLEYDSPSHASASMRSIADKFRHGSLVGPILQFDITGVHVNQLEHLGPGALEVIGTDTDNGDSHDAVLWQVANLVESVDVSGHTALAAATLADTQRNRACAVLAPEDKLSWCLA